MKSPVATLVLLLAGICAAVEPEEALAGSARFVRGAGAVSVSFELEQADSTGATSSQKGTLLLGDAVRFRLKMPGMTLISDGKTYWEHREASKQVLVRNVSDLPAGFQPAKMLFQYLECRPLSATTTKEKKGELVRLELDPTGRMGNLAELTVWLKPKTWAPARIRAKDLSGNVATYELTSLKTGAKTSPSDFVYAKTEGVDEIDMR